MKCGNKNRMGFSINAADVSITTKYVNIYRALIGFVDLDIAFFCDSLLLPTISTTE